MGALPRKNLYRAIRPGLELREADGAAPTLHGHFAVFNEWTEIASAFEGTFMERVAPGAFSKTFNENRSGMRVLLNHGRSLDNTPIAAIEELREDERGAYYEARLLEGLPPHIVAGIRAGQYGASFRFEVMREELVDRPKQSSYNPQGIAERTIKEARVYEFGPVTFPAYPGATAGIRSITDEFMAAPATPGAAVKAMTPHSGQARRVHVSRDDFMEELRRKQTWTSRI